MNKDQLAALTNTERLLEVTAKSIGLNGVVALIVSLADARLEVARLTEERAGYKRLALDVREAADEELRQASEIVRVSREERDQQREDIRRLVKMAEDVRAMPGAGRELLALLSEMKERYDA